MEFKNIQSLLGLHQSLVVIYTVDGYEATLYGDDDDNIVILRSCVEDSVFNAIKNLEMNLEES